MSRLLLDVACHAGPVRIYTEIGRHDQLVARLDDSGGTMGSAKNALQHLEPESLRTLAAALIVAADHVDRMNAARKEVKR